MHFNLTLYAASNVDLTLCSSGNGICSSCRITSCWVTLSWGRKKFFDIRKWFVNWASSVGSPGGAGGRIFGFSRLPDYASQRRKFSIENNSAPNPASSPAVSDSENAVVSTPSKEDVDCYAVFFPIYFPNV